MQAQGWELKEGEKQVLSIARTYKTKNFVKVHGILHLGGGTCCVHANQHALL